MSDRNRQIVWSLQITFPHNKHIPPLRPEQCLVLNVSCAIASKFSAPILLIRLRSLTSRFAIMPMPKAAMNKDDFTPLRKHQVGVSW